LERNFINREEIVQIYATGLRKMLKLYKGNIITEVLEPSINENGIVNARQFLPRLAAVEFKYYSQLEDWDMLMSINHKKDYYILRHDMPINEIADIFSNHFNIDAPNTKQKATTQDSLTGVQLRELKEMS